MWTVRIWLLIGAAVLPAAAIAQHDSASAPPNIKSLTQLNAEFWSKEEANLCDFSTEAIQRACKGSPAVATGLVARKTLLLANMDQKELKGALKTTLILPDETAEAMAANWTEWAARNPETLFRVKGSLYVTLAASAGFLIYQLSVSDRRYGTEDDLLSRISLDAVPLESSVAEAQRAAAAQRASHSPQR